MYLRFKKRALLIEPSYITPSKLSFAQSPSENNSLTFHLCNETP